MSRDDLIQLEGVVTEVKSTNYFTVKTDAGPVVTAQLSGRMRKFRIRVVQGDRVVVSVSPYDPTHGLITYRPK